MQYGCNVLETLTKRWFIIEDAFTKHCLLVFFSNVRVTKSAKKINSFYELKNYNLRFLTGIINLLLKINGNFLY